MLSTASRIPTSTLNPVFPVISEQPSADTDSLSLAATSVTSTNSKKLQEPVLIAEISGLKDVSRAHIIYGISVGWGASIIPGKSEFEHIKAVADFLNLTSSCKNKLDAKPKVAELAIVDGLQYRNAEIYLVSPEEKQATKVIDEVNNPIRLKDEDVRDCLLSLQSVIPEDQEQFDIVDIVDLRSLMVKAAAQKTGAIYKNAIQDAWLKSITGIDVRVTNWSDVYTNNRYLEVKENTHERRNFQREIERLMSLYVESKGTTFKTMLDKLVCERIGKKKDQLIRAADRLKSIANEEFLKNIKHKGLLNFIKALNSADPIEVGKVSSRQYFIEELAYMSTVPINTRFVYSREIPKQLTKLLDHLRLGLSPVLFKLVRRENLATKSFPMTDAPTAVAITCDPQPLEKKKSHQNTSQIVSALKELPVSTRSPSPGDGENLYPSNSSLSVQASPVLSSRREEQLLPIQATARMTTLSPLSAAIGFASSSSSTTDLKKAVGGSVGSSKAESAAGTSIASLQSVSIKATPSSAAVGISNSDGCDVPPPGDFKASQLQQLIQLGLFSPAVIDAGGDPQSREEVDRRLEAMLERALCVQALRAHNVPSSVILMIDDVFSRLSATPPRKENKGELMSKFMSATAR